MSVCTVGPVQVTGSAGERLARWIVAAICLTAIACGGAGFERAPDAKKYRPLPLGSAVRVAGTVDELSQPVEWIGVLRTSTRGDPADRVAAEEVFKKHAARYGCDAVADIASTRREVKTTRRNKTLGANGVPVYVDEVVVTPEHDWEARCYRTADAPPDPSIAPRPAGGAGAGGGSDGQDGPKTDRAAADKAAAERALADKAAADRAAADRAAAQQALAARAAAEKAAADKAAADKAAADKPANDKGSTVGGDRAAADKAAAEKAAAERAAADRAAAEAAAAEAAAAERAAAEKAMAEKAAAERAAADKAAADRAAADKAAANSAATASERPAGPAAAPSDAGDPKIASEVARAFIGWSDAMVRGNIDKLCATLDDNVVFDIQASQPRMRVKQELASKDACESLRSGELAAYVRDLGPAEVHAEVATLIPTLFGIHRGAYLRLDDQQQKRYVEELGRQREGKKPLACTMYNVMPAEDLFKISLNCTGVASFRLLVRRVGENSFRVMQLNHVRP